MLDAGEAPTKKRWSRESDGSGSGAGAGGDGVALPAGPPCASAPAAVATANMRAFRHGQATCSASRDAPAVSAPALPVGDVGTDAVREAAGDSIARGREGGRSSGKEGEKMVIALAIMWIMARKEMGSTPQRALGRRGVVLCSVSLALRLGAAGASWPSRQVDSRSRGDARRGRWEGGAQARNIERSFLHFPCPHPPHGISPV